ncbi:MAG: type III-A CRISPR-associated protein Cas10/Csm1 [Ignavibacterium sp.]|jgi:CRISPR-associated protein Csm1|uniref:type III-A CRISPR-associated protein Cas10/Csm1 n=1 Tax=Ignavibacterium sp. TaxID=2651167 RepID=UPI003296C229
MTAEEKTLILGALFHDIGKFEQRGFVDKRENHQTLSSGFVNRIFKNERLATIVANHHENDLKDAISKNELKGTDKILAEIICEADNISSGERQPDKTVTKQQPLESIFSKVDYGKSDQKLYYQDICEVFYNKYEFPLIKDEYNLDNLEQNYSDWWKDFENEIKKANRNELETLYYILKKYLWCIPSSSYKTRSDVSLFEHSKITAAIAISMYRFLLEKFENDINKFNGYDNREESRYQLVLSDITGIQNYIYNIGHKGAAKALKGRSFYLQQMLENIAYYFLNKLDLPITNLIYSSGGKFYLFVPNTKTVNDCLMKVQKEIEHAFLLEYNGALGIIIGKIELSGKDLEYKKKGNEHPISEKWDELNAIVEISKKRKLALNWDYSYFEPSLLSGDIEKCKHTNVYLIEKYLINNSSTKVEDVSIGINKLKKYTYEDKDKNKEWYQVCEENDVYFISKEQFYSQKLGYDLKHNFETLVLQDVIDECYPVLNLNSFYISKDYEYKNNYGSKEPRQFLINSLKISELKGEAQKGFKFYGGDWRFENKDKEKKTIPTYEEVAEYGVGLSRLGILRLDVDNLGKIFKDGFGKHATFGRIVQLSSMLDFFFSHYLNKIKFFYWDPIKGLSEKYDEHKYKVKELVEIVYSGGDDVFIVGHWSLLPDIAIWINEKFKEFTAHNDNFSISAGITLFDDKYPIYKSALEAGEYEDKAKKKERKNRDANLPKTKNGICFLDKETPVSWNDFKQIREYVTEFYKWINIGINEKKLSKGLISRLYSIYYEYEEGKYKNWEKWRWRASYSLSRLARQYEEPFGNKLRNFAAELFTSNKTEQELINLLYIIANWTDLLTRKENKNDK